MLKLFKYEFRKSLAVKVIILCITALIEFFFLIGLYGENDNIFAASAFFLFSELSTISIVPTLSM